MLLNNDFFLSPLTSIALVMRIFCICTACVVCVCTFIVNQYYGSHSNIFTWLITNANLLLYLMSNKLQILLAYSSAKVR